MELPVREYDSLRGISCLDGGGSLMILDLGYEISGIL